MSRRYNSDTLYLAKLAGRTEQICSSQIKKHKETNYEQRKN